MPTQELQKRKSLGRGLEALIPLSERTKQIADAEIGTIKSNPHQPRQHFAKSELEDLAESIRQHGILQPLLVKQDGKKYILIAGERRLQAAKIAGLDRVPIVIRDVTPKEILEIAIIENVQRADLNPLEQAIAFQQLMDEFGLSQQEVARRVGKNYSTISNSLRLLHLPQEVKKALVEGSITEGHARALLGSASNKVLLHLFNHVLEDKLSVRETEKLVRESSLISSPSSNIAKIKHHRASLPEKIKKIEKKLQQKVGLPVMIGFSQRGGKITIRFEKVDQLESLLQQLS